MHHILFITEISWGKYNARNLPKGRHPGLKREMTHCDVLHSTVFQIEQTCWEVEFVLF